MGIFMVTNQGHWSNPNLGESVGRNYDVGPNREKGPEHNSRSKSCSVSETDLPMLGRKHKI